MPKRMIDGDQLWVSEKLTLVPVKYRVEYAWLLPLAQVNGCFECSPMLVWRTCYSALRPDWSMDDVTAMLDAFGDAKMLFRWKVNGKTYGFFPGAQKEGRLPGAAERAKYRAPWNSGMVPGKELASFLGVPLKQVSAEYRGLLSEASKNPRRTSLVGNGIGDGGGLGLGNGSGVGKVEAGDTTPLSPSPANNDNSSLSESPKDKNQTPDTEPDPVWFARQFHTLLESNEHSDSSRHGKNWLTKWTAEFESMLDMYPGNAACLLELMLFSQSKVSGQQEYNITPYGLREHLSLLEEKLARHKKKHETAWATRWNDWLEEIGAVQEEEPKQDHAFDPGEAEDELA